MIGRYDPEVVKNLMPLIVNVLGINIYMYIRGAFNQECESLN